MARAINCDVKDCTTQMPNPFDNDYVTIVVTIGKGVTKTLRRDLCDEHITELADFLNAELRLTVPVPQPEPAV